MDILMQIFELCVVPLLGILTTFLVKYINQKSSELQASTSNEILSKYIRLLDKTITDSVISVNQTYVDALKGKNAFTEEAQKEAYKKALEAIRTSLPEEAIVYLREVYTDLYAYLHMKIEAEVKKNKEEQ